MPDQQADSSATIRRLLNRKDLAAARQRAALARLLRLSDTEVLAVAHLAQHGQLTPTRLGGLLHLSSAGTSALVARLERTGQVTRVAHPRDGRSTLLRLTPAAVEAAGAALAPLVAELDGLAAALSADERAVVGRFLGAVAAAGERHADRLRAEADAEELEESTAPVPGLWA